MLLLALLLLLQEPLRSLMFNPSAVRDGYPTCHAHYPAAKDGVDTLVGIANGEGGAGSSSGSPQLRELLCRLIQRHITNPL
jgi:hypothetical protein